MDVILARRAPRTRTSQRRGLKHGGSVLVTLASEHATLRACKSFSGRHAAAKPQRKFPR